MKDKLKKQRYSICLTTYFDKNFSEMGEISLKSIREYADKFNIDVKLLNNINSNRPPAWNKILIVKKLLENYDFVFWIDADALFVRFNEDIRNEIENGKDFYLVKHYIKERWVPNSGSFLIRNSDWGKKFLDDVWNKKEYIYHNYWENAAIIDLLGYKEVMYFNKYKMLANKIFYKLKIKKQAVKAFNLSKKILFFNKSRKDDNAIVKNVKYPENPEIIKKVKWIDLKWNNLPGVAETKNPIINHYPAKPYEERLKKMRIDSIKI